MAGDLLDELAAYAVLDAPLVAEAAQAACLCLTDALACAVGALAEHPLLVGPLFEDASGGPCRVPGLTRTCDPAKAAFDAALLIRWMDFSDTSVLGGHPSDNLGAILAAAQLGSLREARAGRPALTMGHVARAMRTAYEIQGCLAGNRVDAPEVGLDHVFYVKLASTAAAAVLLGATRRQIRNALSSAVLDGHSLNAYRHVPNAGTRKGWAGAEASSRGLVLAAMAIRGEMGYADPLGAPVWGFEAVHLRGRTLRLGRTPGDHFLRNVIFKLVPCQRNGSTAVEAALRLHPWFTTHGGAMARIEIDTQDEAIRRIDKTGPLPNAAARDHCLQYMVAAGLLHGHLSVRSYDDAMAADGRIDALRTVTVVREDPGFTTDHHDPAVQSCANALRLVAKDGAVSERVEIARPIGDPARRSEAMPLLHAKFRDLTAPLWSSQQQDTLLALLSDPQRLLAMPVPHFMDAVTPRDDREPDQPRQAAD